MRLFCCVLVTETVVQNEWLATDSQNVILNNFEEYSISLWCDSTCLSSLDSIVFLKIVAQLATLNWKICSPERKPLIIIIINSSTANAVHLNLHSRPLLPPPSPCCSNDIKYKRYIYSFILNMCYMYDRFSDDAVPPIELQVFLR